MQLTLTVCAESSEVETFWSDQIKSFLVPSFEFNVQTRLHYSELGQLLFVDARLPELELFVSQIDRKERLIFLMVPDINAEPGLWAQGKVDDLIVIPLRALEVLSKLRSYEQKLAWNQVLELNLSISSLLEKLKDDFELAERLQKVHAPKRFPHLKGLSVASRYFAGIKSGGDYFDIAESEDNAFVSLILTHSTSYGLCNAVLTTLVRVIMKLTSNQLTSERAVSSVVRQIYHELSSTLGEKDQLSFFYGLIHRQSQRFQFLNLGDSRVYYAAPGQEFEILPQQGNSISRAPLVLIPEHQIQLSPGGRMVLLSFGFVEGLGESDTPGGNPGRLLQLLNQMKDDSGIDIVNELAFQLKTSIPAEEGMPSRDCTCMVLDFDGQILRLAKREQDENLT